MNITALGSYTNAVAAHSYTTGSVTPSANKLILLAIEFGDNDAPGDWPVPTVTGCGLTWELVNSVNFSEDGTDLFWDKVCLFRAMGASPTAGGITIDVGARWASYVSVSISEVDGMDTSGTNGSGAIVQTAGLAVQNATSLTATLSAFSSSSNFTFSAVGSSYGTATSWTPGSGFTEIHDVNGGVGGIMTQWKGLADTTVEATAAATTNAAIIAIELKEAVAVSVDPQFRYGVFRDWNCVGIEDASIWQSNGSITETLVRQVYDAHLANGAKVLKVFGTVPSWAAKRPAEANPHNAALVGSLSGPADLVVYKDYVKRFIQTFRNYLWAVQGWNEPYPSTAVDTDPDWPQYTTMTTTELADVQQAIYEAAKEVDEDLLVFGPPQAYVNGIDDLLSATTTEGNPISDYFDVMSWHAYNRDADGTASDNNLLSDEIAAVRAIMATHGIGDMPLADTAHGWKTAGDGGAAFAAMTEAEKAAVIYATAEVARDEGLLAIIFYSYESEMMGQPVTSTTISQSLDDAYRFFETGFATDDGSGEPPDTDEFAAAVTQAPANNATISGVVTITISGLNIHNAELLPEFGYLPIYASFTLSTDRTIATLSFDTTSLSDRTQKFRVSAFNTPPNVPGSSEIVVFTRTWTIDNAGTGTTVPASSVIVDYYGDSTAYGTNGGAGDARVANPVPAQLAAAYPGMVVRNEGVPSTDTTMLRNGTDGVHPVWTTQMANSTATHVLCNHGINDWVDANVLTENLVALIAGARAAGKVMVLVTPNPTFLELAGGTGDEFVDARAQIIRNVAFANSVDLIDVNQMVLDYLVATPMTRAEFTPDGIHPAQAGYDVIADYVIEQFGLISGVVAGGAGPSPSPGPVGSVAMQGPVASNFSLTFFDDFDGTSIDTGKWGNGMWYDQGGNAPNTTRVINGELQMTGQSSSIFTGANDTNYTLFNTSPDVAGAGFLQRYGVYQIEAKLGAGRGYWPSFWLFGHESNHRPEIDIFEGYPGGNDDWTIGSNPPKPGRVDSSVHSLNDPGGYAAPKVDHFLAAGLDLSAAFHTYTFEWDQTFMKFYFDGNLVWTMTDADNLAFINQFQMYIILGLGINYATANGPSTDQNITPVGFGSDPNNPPINVYRIKYCAAWQWNKYL